MAKAEDNGPGSFVRGPKLTGFVTSSILRQFRAHPNPNPFVEGGNNLKDKTQRLRITEEFN